MTTTRRCAGGPPAGSPDPEVPAAWDLAGPSAAAGGTQPEALGLSMLELEPRQQLQTVVPQGCDLVLLGVSGTTRLGTDGVLAAGQLVVWPRGRPLRLEAPVGSARVCVLAAPPGADQLLRELSRGDLPVDVVVALAADAGVELVLPESPAEALPEVAAAALPAAPRWEDPDDRAGLLQGER